MPRLYEQDQILLLALPTLHSGGVLFLTIFVVWAIGRSLGFASLHSLLAGIGLFLLLSAGYVLLLYRGASQHHNLEALLRDDADQAVLNANPADREEVSLLRERLLQSIERLHSNKPRGTPAKDVLYALPWYLVIGQPAAGKSTMIYQSGLSFPMPSAKVHGSPAWVAHATAIGSSAPKPCCWTPPGVT